MQTAVALTNKTNCFSSPLMQKLFVQSSRATFPLSSNCSGFSSRYLGATQITTILPRTLNPKNIADQGSWGPGVRRDPLTPTRVTYDILANRMTKHRSWPSRYQLITVLQCLSIMNSMWYMLYPTRQKFPATAPLLPLVAVIKVRTG